MLSKNIRRLAKEQGLSYADIGREAGVTRGAIHYLATGQRKNPRLNTLRQVSKALGVEVQDLIK